MGIVIAYVGQNLTMYLDRVYCKRGSYSTGILQMCPVCEGRFHSLCTPMSFVLLGSSVTSTTHGKEYHYNVITCLCWCGLIHKFSVKICCGLCWMLMNVFRANEQATTLPKFASLLIVAVFPALYKNCFLLFHLPVPLYYSKDFMLRLHVLPCT